MPTYILVGAVFVIALLILLVIVVLIRVSRWLVERRRLNKDLKKSRRLLSNEQSDLHQFRRKALIELSQEVEKHSNIELVLVMRDMKEVEREAFDTLKKSLNGQQK